jgi:hypothetical protein
MKPHKVSLLFGCLLLVCSVRAADDNFTIVPGRNAGPLRIVTSEADLRKLFGAAQVKSDKVYIGEGFVCEGAILFPNDPLRTADIVWMDVTHRARPLSVRISTKKSLWRTAEGVTLGTSLIELERLNGKPFKFLGFGWDYSGTVVSWEGGKLETFKSAQEHGHRLIVRLTPDPPAETTPDEADRISGDRELLSSDPLIQRLNPKVYDLEYDFDQSVHCKSEFRG